MRKISVVVAAVSLCLVAASQVIATDSVQKLNDNARINWTKLEYVATGEGAMPSVKAEPNRARAYLKAKGYARMAATANLLAAVEGTTISFEATGKDYMEEATVRQKIEGYVKNVEITKTSKETIEGDTVVIVEVRAPMFGQNGPGTVLLGEQIKEEKAKVGEGGKTEISVETNVKVTLKQDLKPIKEITIEPARASTDPGYSSVIIDTTGYKLDRCMSPKIRRDDGSEVWGSVKADPDLVLERGVVSYATTLQDAKTSPRCGSNPLLIKAIGRAGGRFNSDPVIGDEDAQIMLSENAKSGFLDKLNVIVVKDGRL
ncbi:MAG: hypothetical protein M1133_00330 [Armatimonadetes bacterium]|nr:hypothetical protein [Armatimonadota bacterium]